MIACARSTPYADFALHPHVLHRTDTTQERRASGRKQAAPGLVVQGSVRVVASLATRLRSEEGLRLPAGYVEDWRRLRTDLDKRRESRRKQRRFRRDPTGYLSHLEERCLDPSLPA